jgi:hypothetical protein
MIRPSFSMLPGLIAASLALVACRSTQPAPGGTGATGGAPTLPPAGGNGGGGTGGGPSTTGGVGGGAGAGGATGGTGGSAVDPRTTVVIFLIDGLQADAARTAAANGAANLKLVIDNGVMVTTARSTSPAARTTLPSSAALLWGNATSGNIAVHTGTHVYEAGPGGLDDIFVAARAAGIKSVFSGGDNNYSGLNTADFKYASTASSDEAIVTNAINHLRNDKVRLIRIHLQRLRDDWSGPAGKTNPTSAYQRHILANDALLGQLIQALEDEGVWESTYLVITADHGMGPANDSSHPATTASSWDIFMAFHGPGLKKGATIPYAELPDVAVTATHFLGLPPLKGHTGNVTLAHKGPTGTVLTNLFEGAPAEVAHPRYIQQYLDRNTFPTTGDDYLPYRAAMLELIK